MNDNMELGKRIANYRKSKRVTQSELAEAVGVLRRLV